MNELNVKLVALLGFILYIGIFDIIVQHHSCRKARFDCDFCKYWPCPAHRCRYEREKRNQIQNEEFSNDCKRS